MKRIVVLGAGESGAGAAVLAKKQGFDVFVSDTSKVKDQYKKLLDDHGIAWEEGHHTEEKVLSADEVIKSPGIPDSVPMIQRLIQQGTPIISEIEFAGRYTHSKMVCITGSNGKTTTTSLIYHIFKDAGYDVGLAGNIGRSLALQVAEDPHEYYVIELSSFQLDNMYEFRANIAILLNITPDHLDRYDFKFENYAAAKMRIIQNQTQEDSFIYWNDDPVIKKELEKYDIKAVQYPFSELKETGSIGYIEEGQYVIEKPTPFNMEQEELSLTGKHNIYNSLAAGIASNISGIRKESIRKSLSDFRAWNTDWRRSARWVACSMSTTPRPPMSMLAGTRWRACARRQCSSSAARTRATTMDPSRSSSRRSVEPSSISVQTTPSSTPTSTNWESPCETPTR